jgi:lantibiotic biosynthesis protein
MNIEAEDIFLLRTPAFSVSHIIDNAPNDLSNFYLQFLQNNFFQQAIYTASPELYQEAMKWLAGVITDSKKINKLLLSLHRYYLRMCCRCTPYGLLAGCAVGTLSDTTHLQLASYHLHTPHARLDMNCLAEIINTIHAIPGVKKYLQYFCNNSLYKTANTYRYVAYFTKNKIRSYCLASIDASVYTQKILETAVTGASIDLLIAVLADDGISTAEATLFIDELIESQLLITQI